MLEKNGSAVHFVQNYIFAGKVNFEGSLNGWECSSGGSSLLEETAVIKSDCVSSWISPESRISGDVKPCLTPQLDNCGCGS